MGAGGDKFDALVNNIGGSVTRRNPDMTSKADRVSPYQNSGNEPALEGESK